MKKVNVQSYINKLCTYIHLRNSEKNMINLKVKDKSTLSPCLYRSIAY